MCAAIASGNVVVSLRIPTKATSVLCNAIRVTIEDHCDLVCMKIARGSATPKYFNDFELLSASIAELGTKINEMELSASWLRR